MIGMATSSVKCFYFYYSVQNLIVLHALLDLNTVTFHNGYAVNICISCIISLKPQSILCVEMLKKPSSQPTFRVLL